MEDLNCQPWLNLCPSVPPIPPVPIPICSDVVPHASYCLRLASSLSTYWTKYALQNIINWWNDNYCNKWHTVPIQLSEEMTQTGTYDVLCCVLILILDAIKSELLTKTKLHGLSLRANYTDWVTAACRQSDCQLLLIKSAMWSVWRIPMAIFSVL
jgi:hypothetical protein